MSGRHDLLLLVLPSDHVIADGDELIANAAAAR